jgi:hypothetical protein
MSKVDSTKVLLSVTRRLFIALAVSLAIALAIGLYVSKLNLPNGGLIIVPGVVIASGIIGGFVGLQRRLKDLTIFDLQLMADDWIYTCLSPFVGGVLALLLYVLFLSDLIKGGLFPEFVSTNLERCDAGFRCIFEQHGTSYKEYAKLIFWCFVAGYSERFVTDIIGRFEGAAVKSLPQSAGIQDAQPGASADPKLPPK